jgi:hypothetical protein
VGRMDNGTLKNIDRDLTLTAKETEKQL